MVHKHTELQKRRNAKELFQREVTFSVSWLRTDTEQDVLNKLLPPVGRLSLSTPISKFYTRIIFIFDLWKFYLFVCLYQD